MRIQYAEPVSVVAAAGTTEFEAYGRRFSLELSTNDRLLARLPAQRKAELSRYRVLRGRLSGQSSSWVRLTEFGGRVEGAIWDGKDMYAVTRYQDVAHALATPLPVRDDQTVVFRLSDTFNALPPNFCATTLAPTAAKGANALEQYKTLISELRANALSVPVTKQMDVALVGDHEYQSQESTDPTGAMLARLNIADGIYADDIGLLLNAGAMQLVPVGSDPFTTTDPEALLGQVSNYRATTPAVRSAGVTHLITGKSLPGSTVGIARISGACTLNDGVSLSESGLGVFVTGLIMAHEIGHNLGAEHDGTGNCSTVPEGYIMWPSLSTTSTHFSQCSASAIRQFISTASSSCMTSASVADVTLSLGGPGEAELQVPTTLTATVVSAGTQLARNVGVTFNIPAAVTPTAITPSAGTCTLSPVSCTFGDLAPGEQRTVTISVTPVATTFQATATAQVSASNDRVVNNDSAYVDFSVVNNADAAVSVSPTRATVNTGEPVDYTITIRSIRSQTVKNATMFLSLSGLNQVTFTPSAGSCISGNCNFGDLAPGATVTLAVHGIGYEVGTWRHDIQLQSQNESGNNNFASFSLTVNPSGNVGITGMPMATINPGDSLQTQFTVVNSKGFKTASNVAVTLYGDAYAPIQAASVDGGTCTVDSGFRANCQLGDLAVGASRTLIVTAKGTLIGFSAVTAEVSASPNDDHTDDRATNSINIKNPVDLRVTAPGLPDRVEGSTTTDKVTIYSASTVAATDFVATVELPATVRLTALTMADTTCQIVDNQHGRCTAATLPNQQIRELVMTTAVSEPGVKNVHVTIAAASDADTSDNACDVPLRVTPYLDAGVTPISLPQFLQLGQVYSFETHLKTAYRDVANVGFTVTYPLDVTVALPADLTGCVIQQDVSNLYESQYCLMPLVPANTDRLLKFTLTAKSVRYGGRVGVQAITSPDVDWSNNSSEQFVQVVEMSDVSVKLAQPSASTTVRTPVALPRITVHAGAKDVQGIVLKVPIPSFATVKTVTTSSGNSCTGSPTLTCNLFGLGAGSDTTVDITLDTQLAGTFTSKVEVSAANDSDATNNIADLAITVSAAGGSNPPGAGSSGGGGGGGGGGRFEWLTVTLLGALLAWRQGGSPFAKSSAGAMSSHPLRTDQPEDVPSISAAVAGFGGVPPRSDDVRRVRPDHKDLVRNAFGQLGETGKSRARRHSSQHRASPAPEPHWRSRPELSRYSRWLPAGRATGALCPRLFVVPVHLFRVGQI